MHKHLQIQSRILLMANLAVAGLVAAAASPAFGTEDLGKVIADADLARGAVPGGVSWSVLVHTVDEDKTTEVSYDVKIKGSFARMEAVSPAKNVGEALLVRDGDMYFHKPGVKRPMVISSSQKLSGPAANGDISVTNYQRDYDATLIGEESVGGVPCYKLVLKAKAGRKPSYTGVRYWVTKDQHLGLKAEFLTASGEVFKTAEYKYTGHLKIDGKDRPFVSEMVFRDAAKSQNISTVTVSHVVAQTFDDSQFTLSNFAK